MAILAVLLVLILGYIHALAVPYERVKLKRSEGWEAYVYLAKHGLFFLTAAITIVIAALFFCFIIELALAQIDKTLYLNYAYKEINFSEINLNNICVIAAIVVISLFISFKIAIRKTGQNSLDMLRKEDSMLNVVIESMIESRTIKVSLKSRKVYVGLVQTEQFDRADLDNIVIIPFMSGYRDDSKLRIEFDCNYIKVYQKNQILDVDNLSEQQMQNLDKFRLVIRMEEVESISLFDANYYEQFEFKEGSNCLP